MEAILCNNYEIAKLLHEKGASVSLTSMAGVCATDLASANPEKSIRDYFGRLANADEEKRLFLAVELENVEIIQQSTHDLNIRNYKGFTPLMVAAAKGSVGMIKSLITNGSSLDLQTKDGMTAIGCAVGQGNLKAVDVLIGYGADINMKNNQGETLLHRWIREGSLTAVKVIERLGANLEVTDKSGHTALMLASQNDNMEIAEYLVEAGANLNTRHSDGFKASDCAKNNGMHAYLTGKEKEYLDSTTNSAMGLKLIEESRSCDSKIIDQLLASVAPVNYRGSLTKGTTPLMQACQLGHYNNVKKLYDAGAKTYIKNEDGVTPLGEASANCHTEIVKYLLERKANPNTVDNNGRTPLMYATQNGHQAITELLIQHGALVNIREKKNGSSALNVAVCHRNVDIFHLLLEHNANIYQVDYEGYTALTHVCRSGNIGIVTCLVDKGADVNHKDFLGHTPLMASLQEGQLNVVEYLVENGADLSIVFDNIMKVMEYAERKGHSDVLRWLQRHGGQSVSGNNTLGQDNNTNFIDMHPNDIKDPIYKALVKQDVNEQLRNPCETGQRQEDIEDVLNQAAVIDEKDAEGVTPLLKAVRSRNQQTAYALLEAGADVNTKDLQGCSQLLQAVKNGDKDMIEMLAQFNVDVAVVDNYGDDVFSYATKASDEEIVMTLIQLFERCPSESSSSSTEPISQEARDVSSLLTAVQDGNIDRVQDVVQQVDPNVTDECSRNAIHYCSNQMYSQILECLYNAGTDINLKDVSGQTPLIECCQAGNVVVARKLLHLGADTGVISTHGVDALQEACMGNHCELVSILLHSATWPSDSINKSISYSLLNHFHRMISTFHSNGINVSDIFSNLSTSTCTHCAHLCLQDLQNSGMWDLCHLLASENDQVFLRADVSADDNVSSVTKDKAWTIAVRRGDYELARMIYKTHTPLTDEVIGIAFDGQSGQYSESWADETLVKEPVDIEELARADQKVRLRLTEIPLQVGALECEWRKCFQTACHLGNHQLQALWSDVQKLRAESLDLIRSKLREVTCQEPAGVMSEPQSDISVFNDRMRDVQDKIEDLHCEVHNKIRQVQVSQEDAAQNVKPQSHSNDRRVLAYERLPEHFSLFKDVGQYEEGRFVEAVNVSGHKLLQDSKMTPLQLSCYLIKKELVKAADFFIVGFWKEELYRDWQNADLTQLLAALTGQDIPHQNIPRLKLRRWTATCLKGIDDPYQLWKVVSKWNKN